MKREGEPSLPNRKKRRGPRPGPVGAMMLLGVAGGLFAAQVARDKAPARPERVEVAPEIAAPAPTPAAEATPPPEAEPLPAPEPEVVRRTITDRIRPRETLSVALIRHGVSHDEVNRLALALKGKLDVRAIRPGDVYVLEEIVCGDAAHGPCTEAHERPRAEMKLEVFSFKPRVTLGPPVTIRATLEEDGSYRVVREETPIEVKTVALGGEVTSSLYEAIIGQGEGSDLVNRFVDVFAWDIDFYRETQKGDSYKVIVEKQYAEGRFIGYGRVLAAEYVNAGTVYRGFNFRSDDGKVVGIFDEKGHSREKTFLKNPLEIARITSRYGQRFHPVLRRKAKHNGVDYGAARGTPFWAVADGVIKEARYSPAAGNMIVVRHANGYETEYFHASRFAKGIRPGVKVKQRQVIGYVGNTGRSTGPHLHFGMKKRGAYVDPAKQRFPKAKPVPEDYLREYLEAIGPLLAELEALQLV